MCTSTSSSMWISLESILPRTMAQRTLGFAWLLGGLLLLLTVAIAEHSPWNLRSKATVFADLSPEELRVVQSFLLSKKDLKLAPSKDGTMNKNSIFLIEMLLPKKHQVLKFLDEGGNRPVREARVIIFFGAQEHPNITEFAVGPLPWPSYMRMLPPKPGHSPSWGSRPITSTEYYLLYHFLQDATEPLYRFFRDTTGFWLHNCTDHCLTFTDVSPRGLASGQRSSWFIMQRFVEGYFLHPTGMEILVDHKSSDPQEWRVERVWYNGQFYENPEDLARKYEQGKVNVVILEDLPPKGKMGAGTEEQPLFSSYQPRGDFPTPTARPGPHLVEPQGPRYKLEGNAVLYGGWSFAFRLRSSSGLQILNLRFGGERIAYEVSVQEAVALYGGHTPAGMQTKYIDVGWGLGSVTHELAPGIDCPKTATFLDAHHFYDANAPTHYPNALCLFEMPTGVPLRRHFDSDFSGGFNFYAGLEGQVLVLRTTSTVYNYDYLWDFIFHHNGVMEAKMHATGYVHATFFTPEGLRHGTRLHTHLLGNIHTHLIHYRVDLDVAGTNNGFETMGTKLENITNPWNSHYHVVQPVLERNPRHRERHAAFRFGRKLPKFLLFTSPKKNLWGHPRSYRIQLHSMADQVLPPGWQEERTVTWARYPLAVTKYRESELVSSSIYNQNDPWDPPVVFEEFLRNNENIENEDLVAWVTVGFLHIPHSEDIPNTATPGNSVGFLLRPFNFFSEDPSLASKETVIVRSQAKGPNHIERWTSDNIEGCWKASPFNYNGTYRPV